MCTVVCECGDHVLQLEEIVTALKVNYTVVHERAYHRLLMLPPLIAAVLREVMLQVCGMACRVR